MEIRKNDGGISNVKPHKKNCTRALIKVIGIKRFIKVKYLLLADRHLPSKPILSEFVKQKNGLEIGGPTGWFLRGTLRIYDLVNSLDNVNFSNKTIWNTNLMNGRFYYGNRFGKDYILEASNLCEIPDESYDFVISSHMIEHLSNPIKAIFEMKRVIKQNGFIIIVAPHKEITFDHARKVTDIQHMIEDYLKNVEEGSIDHLDMEEIIKNYDYDLDCGFNTKEEFFERTKLNKLNRALHQHVFVTDSILKLLDYAGLEIILVKPSLLYGILAIGKKSSNDLSDIHKNSMIYLSKDAKWRKKSPFILDKHSV